MPIDFSTFTAISELFVTAGVLTVIFHNYKKRGFLTKLAFSLVVFEFSVNMLYMISRLQNPLESKLTGGLIILAATHGTLSLIVFILFTVYAFLGYGDWKRGRYFFAEHPVQTKIFLFLWFISVGSGEILYFLPR